jgi:hypothetical protein
VRPSSGGSSGGGTSGTVDLTATYIGYGSPASKLTGDASLTWLKPATAVNSFFVGSTGNTTASGGSNYGIGTGGLVSLTTGTFNYAIGHNALVSCTTCFRNVAIGENVLSQSDGSTGINSVAIGYRAGESAVSARNSVLIGSEAARFKTDVSNSFALGFQTANSAGTRLWNSVLIGNQVASNMTSGTNNIGIGHQVTLGTTSFNNIVVGASAGLPNNTASYRLNIGQTMYGDLAQTGTAILGGAGSIGINQVTPTANLDVSGTLLTSGLATVATLATGAATITGEISTSFAGATSRTLCVGPTGAVYVSPTC